MDEGKKQNMAPMWKKLMKNVDVGEPTSFLDHANLGCAQHECKINEIVIDEFRKMFESRISAGATEKILRMRETSRKDGSVVLRHGRSCSKMREQILRTSKKQKRQNSCTRCKIPDWMIITSRKRNST